MVPPVLEPSCQNPFILLIISVLCKYKKINLDYQVFQVQVKVEHLVFQPKNHQNLVEFSNITWFKSLRNQNQVYEIKNIILPNMIVGIILIFSTLFINKKRDYESFIPLELNIILFEKESSKFLKGV